MEVGLSPGLAIARSSVYALNAIGVCVAGLRYDCIAIGQTRVTLSLVDWFYCCWKIFRHNGAMRKFANQPDACKVRDGEKAGR